MQIVKNNPAFDSPRDKLKSYFSRGDLFFSRDAHICFVCGAGVDVFPETQEHSLRHMFIQHVGGTPDSNIICIRAEHAATELLRQIEERGRNISLFERTIANSVDSLLVFPESPGSFAELGYFSAHPDIAKKMLVAVKVRHQANSFITLGPIHSISKISEYAPVPMALGEDPRQQMRDIAERLLGESVRRRPYRRRYELEAWKEYAGRFQISIIDEIVDLAGALTEKDLLQIIQMIFGAYDVSEVRLLLSLLVAMDRIARNDNGDIYSLRRAKAFVECDSHAERLKVTAAWRDAYETHDPGAVVELDRVRG